jgi:hypothetical protein
MRYSKLSPAELKQPIQDTKAAIEPGQDLLGPFRAFRTAKLLRNSKPQRQSSSPNWNERQRGWKRPAKSNLRSRLASVVGKQTRRKRMDDHPRSPH